MNRGYKPSPRSQGFIDTLAPPLQEIIVEGFYIANTRKLYCPDFSITRGFETASGQFELYKKGRFCHEESQEWFVGDPSKVVTQCDGYEQISDHQQTDINGKAFAFDFAAWVGKTDYQDSNMALIATVFFEAASNQGTVIDWGGNFRSISDGSHISLIV